MAKQHSSASPVQTLLWRLQAWALGGFFGLLRILPLPLATAVAGRLFAAVGPSTRRAQHVRRNLAIAFARQSAVERASLLRASFRHLGVALAELTHMRAIWKARKQRLEFVLAPGAKAPTAHRPTVFVTAHVSAWQMTPLIGPQYGVTLPIIHAAEQNPYIERQLTRLRQAFGCPLVASKGGVRELVQALNQGHCIGLTLDTRLDAGELIPFFAEPAPTNTVAARLALRHGCDLVPVLAERLPNARYRVTLLAPITAQQEQASPALQAVDMTAQLNRLFEQWIVQYPGQWLCMKRRWPKQTERRYAQLPE